MDIEFKKGMFIVVRNSVWLVIGTRGIITADRPQWDNELPEVAQFEKSEVRPYFLQPSDKIYFRGGKSMVMHMIETTDLEEQRLQIKNIYYERGELLVQNIHNDVLTARYIEMSLLYFHTDTKINKINKI